MRLVPRCITHGGITQTRMVRSGSSYLSQSELPVTFGVGTRDLLDRVVITLAERARRRLQEMWRLVSATG